MRKMTTVHLSPPPDERPHGEAINDHTVVRLRCSMIVFRGDRILLIRRVRDGRPEWVLPGGDPHPGEGLAACARRETVEESGLRAEPTRCAFAFETIAPAGTNRTIDIVFLAEHATGEPVGSEPALRPQFVPVTLLSRLPLRPPIGGYLRGLHDRTLPPTIPFLGNLWRPGPVPEFRPPNSVQTADLPRPGQDVT
ncbi:NUDIX domain-containing protein [Nonomuraea sp. MG754425]|uniref:NUDIX domain-containing protein n=1 Tax=Nonomuraea sp. MG754425 TaxID=2570319 RepID=UPI001F2F84CE|nr:NUDIX domain-containing protein [Nonomuraea sp. MG754425]MCF6468557.1 NUDIX domain-containing protein [Nonomuraea sp. MG754425]